jgi:hypothetical protein
VVTPSEPSVVVNGKAVGDVDFETSTLGLKKITWNAIAVERETKEY